MIKYDADLAQRLEKDIEKKDTLIKEYAIEAKQLLQDLDFIERQKNLLMEKWFNLHTKIEQVKQSQKEQARKLLSPIDDEGKGIQTFYEYFLQGLEGSEGAVKVAEEQIRKLQKTLVIDKNWVEHYKQRLKTYQYKPLDTKEET